MAEQELKKEVDEVKAAARGLHISPRKVRLVTDLIKGMTVDEALTQLTFITKKAASPVAKLISSAVANALHNHEIESTRLYIKSISVDGGRVMKRYKPRAQGRAFPIRKRTSHINLILGVSEEEIGEKVEMKTEESKAEKDKDKEKEQEPKEKAVDESKAPKKGWFGRKKGDGAVKKDTKGKGEKTGVVRTGNK